MDPKLKDWDGERCGQKVSQLYNHIFPESLLIWRVTDESQHCKMEGILCLTKHADFLSRQKTRWSDKEGLDCSCLPGCEEPEFNVVRTETHKYD